MSRQKKKERKTKKVTTAQPGAARPRPVTRSGRGGSAGRSPLVSAGPDLRETGGCAPHPLALAGPRSFCGLEVDAPGALAGRPSLSWFMPQGTWRTRGAPISAATAAVTPPSSPSVRPSARGFYPSLEPGQPTSNGATPEPHRAAPLAPRRAGAHVFSTSPARFVPTNPKGTPPVSTGREFLGEPGPCSMSMW